MGKEMSTTSSLEKMLQILNLVEASNGGLTLDTMLDTAGLTRSTLYRYLKTLTDAGLLMSQPDIGYTLGPRIAELDYRMRMQDQLVTAARPVMAELAKVQPGVVMLCRKYRDKVLCVHQEMGTETFHGNYERGYSRPLGRGAASRVILAYSSPRVLERLLQRYPDEFASTGLGSTLPEIRAALADIRQRGWDVTQGEVTPKATGIAAAILDTRGTVIGSLSVVIGRTRPERDEVAKIAERIVFCSAIIGKALV
jgi:DNA-binding IclR family transcriptional regulator